MCHIGDAPGPLEALLDLLRPGDILTHAYSGFGNNTVRDGRVVAAALEAKARGVIIDVGHGAGSFDFTVAEPAIDQGLVPDTISSDIHSVSGNSPGMPYLPWVMSKFLALGVPLDQVIAMATCRPAKIIDRVPLLGTLRIGAPADVAILELVEGPVTFVDTKGHERRGTCAPGDRSGVRTRRRSRFPDRRRRPRNPQPFFRSTSGTAPVAGSRARSGSTATSGATSRSDAWLRSVSAWYVRVPSRFHSIS